MPLSLEEIAILANEYARRYIKKGTTQLETNSYSEMEQLALSSGISDLRDEVKSNVNAHPIEESLEIEIETIQKYSLGNCEEIAKMAFYYVITHHPHIYAGVYSIDKGDHVFLIIGDKKPKKPLSQHLNNWDESAYVCDSWSNKIYPLGEWTQELEAYQYTPVALSEDAISARQIQYEALVEQGVILENPANQTRNFSSTICDKKGNTLGKTHFFYFNRNNYTISLDPQQQFIRPLAGLDSISQYQYGSTYRREKIKSVLIALRPFKDIFPVKTECLQQLLNKRALLWDQNRNKRLGSDEQLQRDEWVNQSIQILNNFKTYLRDSSEPITQKLCVLPISEQIQEIDNTIHCLEQLLYNHVLQDIALFDNTDDKFRQKIKAILKEYHCPASKKTAVKNAMSKADGDINNFIRYFYSAVKPTLQVRRNPILDKIRGFFLSPVDVKGAKIVEQLEEHITEYNKLSPSPRVPLENQNDPIKYWGWIQ
jgi:hypothetical protein